MFLVLFFAFTHMYSSFLDTTFGEKIVDDDSDVCIIWVPSSAAEGRGAPPSLVPDPRVEDQKVKIRSVFGL